MKTKVVANYLPQFHAIPENDKWWGKGYTDWDAVKASKPLFPGHMQPNLPLEGEFYYLDDPDVIRWQASLARDYEVSGFAIYHYWFKDGLHLLGKPAELILKNPDIDIEFLFLWDNVSWVRSWSAVKGGNDWAPAFDASGGRPVLAELDYGDQNDWREHFQYLLPFFEDSRYIKIDGKPLFGFMQPRNDFKTIQKMVDYWDSLARAEGLPGLHCMSNRSFSASVSGCKLQNGFCYAPGVQTIDRWIEQWLRKKSSTKTGKPAIYSYDGTWRSLLNRYRRTDHNVFLSGFVSFDDTPRRGRNARIYRGATPEKFAGYFKRLLELSKIQNKEYVFLSAWNEWGEGMCLEPDMAHGYAWLEGVRDSVVAMN